MLTFKLCELRSFLEERSFLENFALGPALGKSANKSFFSKQISTS